MAGMTRLPRATATSLAAALAGAALLGFAGERHFYIAPGEITAQSVIRLECP